MNQKFRKAAVILAVYLMMPAGIARAGDFSALLGNWQRVDGSYTLTVGKILEDGRMEVGYFNPRPINVSLAEARMEEGRIRMKVELRDKGYPGSTYILYYDPGRDALLGYYYQAVAGQTFEVAFVRKK